jgi:hypothetical protein
LRKGQREFFAMQTITKDNHTSNFTILSNDLVTSTIPPTPKSILIYLLSKPINWKLKNHDLQKQLERERQQASALLTDQREKPEGKPVESLLLKKLFGRK